jgi:nucleoside phosphorylase/predicted nucleotidyltransferase
MEESSEKQRLAELPERAIAIRAPAKNDALNVHASLDLRAAVELLTTHIAGVREVFLFGSRRYQTGSVRSDIDLLLAGDQLPPASVVAAIARDIDSYLDVFIARGSTALSAVNESVIADNDFDSLLRKLDAIPVWRSGDGWIPNTTASTVRVLAGFEPPFTIAAPAGPEPLIGRADVLFVSALAEEHHAILGQFDGVFASPMSGIASYQLGEIHAQDGARRVAACVADRAGTVPAALTTFLGIELFRPNLVVLVGITAGIAGRLNYGDLIVPDTIIEYEAMKIGSSGEDSHGRKHPLHPPSIAAVHAWTGLDQLLKELSTSRPDDGVSQLSTDSMASGNQVVASTERASLIASESRKIVAIEMESLGVVEACIRARPLVPALVVKTVSDMADAAKDDSWHAFATTSAARLAAALVRDRVI